jgi:CubicO group peptidase (beta-lactamase class C family)
MRIKCFVLIGIMGFALLAGCGESANGRNPSTSKAPDRFSKVRAMIQDILQKGGAPSLSIAVAENGNVVWEESFGYADKEKKTVATPDSLYALASISKSMTATGLMVLAERGRLDLDKPVNDYLGEAKLVWPAGDAAQATVKQMIYLEAGMPMHWNIFPTSKPERPPGTNRSAATGLSSTNRARSMSIRPQSSFRPLLGKMSPQSCGEARLCPRIQHHAESTGGER